MNLCERCHTARHGTFLDAWLYYKIKGTHWKFSKYAELVNVERDFLWAEYEISVQIARYLEPCLRWEIDLSLLKEWKSLGVFPIDEAMTTTIFPFERQFGESRSSPDGRHARCAICMREADKERRDLNAIERRDLSK